MYFTMWTNVLCAPNKFPAENCRYINGDIGCRQCANILKFYECFFCVHTRPDVGIVELNKQLQKVQFCVSGIK